MVATTVPIPWYGILVTLLFFNRVEAYTDKQFRHFYGSWDKDLYQIMELNCSTLRNQLYENPKQGGYELLQCMLNYMGEATKVEMGICTVIFGLLPSMMHMIGPEMQDVWRLGIHRPLLTLMLCIGAPTLTLSHGRTNQLDCYKKQPSVCVNTGACTTPNQLWPSFLKHWTAGIAISLLEYLVAFGAAVSALYYGYVLTFYCITFVTTLMGTFGSTQEAFAPLFWMLFPLPIHAMGIVAGYRSAIWKHPPQLSNILDKVKHWIKGEITPCAYLMNYKDVTRLAPSYRSLVFDWVVKISVWVHVMSGTIILSSTIFTNLFDTMRISGLLLGGTMLCRIIVAFELYGLDMHRDPQAEVENADHCSIRTDGSAQQS
ncbi:hypothetical protein E8E13_000728 [Curvularia kusanoi]|uniref:Uncharacterized protein n=1 Tax=Curvularia kusanoi TaxID=90978 RepID=A0A9P4TGU9_CURKU|nr:hypothetical protein E8E13_000728 [Curvularia kusanoi]